MIKSIDVKNFEFASMRIWEKPFQAGKLEDLYFRFSTNFSITVRLFVSGLENIEAFASLFSKNFNKKELGRKVFGFDDQVIDFSWNYYWPGKPSEMPKVIMKGTLLPMEIEMTLSLYHQN